MIITQAVTLEQPQLAFIPEAIYDQTELTRSFDWSPFVIHKSCG